MDNDSFSGASDVEVQGGTGGEEGELTSVNDSSKEREGGILAMTEV